MKAYYPSLPINPLQPLPHYRPDTILTIDIAKDGPACAYLFYGGDAVEFCAQFLGPVLGGALAFEEFLAFKNHGGVKDGGGEYGVHAGPRENNLCGVQGIVT